MYPAMAKMSGTPIGTVNPVGPWRVGSSRSGTTDLGLLIPCSHSGKIVYWMYQMYCTTGIQKW